MRALAAAVTVAVIGVVSMVLGATAPTVWGWNPAAAVVLALAAVWIPQTYLISLLTLRRTTSAPGRSTSA